MQPPYLDRNAVMATLGPADVKDAVRRILVDAANGQAGQAVRRELKPSEMPGLMGLMPSYRSRAPRLFAAKTVCVMPDNPKRGLPAHQGICVLFDGEDGHLVGMAEAGAVTELRTAALAALATQTLARQTPRQHLIVGSGHQALPHIVAMAQSGQAERLVLWGRNPETAADVQRRAADRGIEVERAPDLETAVRGSDVVTMVTGARAPLLKAEWLAPGSHVNAMGSSTPVVREFGPDVIGTAKLFVDDVESVMSLAGEFVDFDSKPPARTLGAVLAGAEGGRTQDNDVMLFKSVGIGIQDLAVLELLFSDHLAAAK
ncbi:ornithine cyclodeaminase family protein [Psychromarinibacter sp. C21-152]|uniref:Ornithine cyclodeaminase family protein n=1 Tax=Psychromarinibacter sediminicola TaxID=3033385 RepID=A0AAE3NS36_9RHOB|nr:ornithine cyclodeaminase family protein [Psychromarinibacter sediminicola]MDF0600991.1 ornithine cyclodeaminase family protein [Psychromarinibacter sediminicola]